MKKLFLLLSFIAGFTSFSIAQGKFSVTLTNTKSVLTFRLKPDVTTTAGFSTIEFFLRYTASSPAFIYSPVTVNTANFPGMTATGLAGSGLWEIEHNNPGYMVQGYNVDHFIYTAPAPVTTVRSYTGGTEYDLISVAVLGDTTKTVDFQLVHENTETKYYLALTGETGNDLRPGSVQNYFYPLTLSTTGPAGSTLYYMERLAVPLPAKLSAFQATGKGCEVDLNWKMAQETNTVYYALERSGNNMDFMEISRTKAASAGNTPRSYGFVDRLALQGPNFYRLKLEDNDGKAEYSAVRQVNINCRQNEAVLVYPSLTSGIVNIKLPPGFELAKVRIVNTLGAEVASSESNSLSRALNLKRFTNGIYIVQVIHNQEITNYVKVVLQQ